MLGVSVQKRIISLTPDTSLLTPFYYLCTTPCNDNSMTNRLPSKSKIQYIETKLARQTDDAQRLYLLDLLASHFTFTNNKKAQVFLSEQQ